MTELKSRLETFLDTAQMNLGYKALAYNDSEFAKQVGHPGSPWDGAFLEVARRAARLGGPNLTNSTAALAWFMQNNRLYRKPRRGDVAFFAFSTHGTFSQPHVGVVTDTSEFRKRQLFRVIEGQTDAGLRRTSTAEDAVHQRTRHIHDTIGFGRLSILEDAPRLIKLNNKIHARLLPTSPGAISSVQLALGDTVGLVNATRGRWDTQTLAAYARWQREVGVYGEHGKPEDRGLKLLGERTGRFAVGE